MLTFKPFFAPKTQVFKDPDTAHVYAAKSRKELVALIVNYRAQNELEPLAHLDIVIDNYQCGLAPNQGSCTPLKKLSRGVFPALRGGIAVLYNVFFGEENMVDKPTADKRSSICASCPHNTFPDKGPFIEWSDNLAVQSTGGKRSAQHDELGNCDICSCPLRAKVWAKAPSRLNKSQHDKLPDFCWQKNHSTVI